MTPATTAKDLLIEELASKLQQMKGLFVNSMPEEFKEIVRKICKKASIPVPNYLGLDNSLTPAAAAYTAPKAGLQMADSGVEDRSRYGIFVGPNLLGSSLSHYAGGLLAHEVGHYYFLHPAEVEKLVNSFKEPDIVFSGDPELMTPDQFTAVYNLTHKQEFQADAFAGNMGYAQELITILSTDERGAVTHDTWRHPPAAERISRLQRFVKPA